MTQAHVTAHSTSAPTAPRRAMTYQTIVNTVFAVFVFAGMMSLIEPSPYDFMSLIAIPLWAIGGFSIHRSQLLILFLWCIFEASGFLALMPYWSEPDPRLYQLQSLYLFVTVIFFTLFFAERTEERTRVCLNAYTAGSIVAAVVGLIGYLDIAGLGAALTTVEGRVSGTFKDPNVLGSYLILAATFLAQKLLLGTTKRIWLTSGGLVLLLIGIFVSYSRGSWGGAIMALCLTTICAYATNKTRRIRNRIRVFAFVALIFAILGVVLILSLPETRDFFLQRATLLQDYDEGVTGRFGNQLRSLPLLLESPLGFGPLRFRLIYGLEPHNSYVGDFANDGWIGGFTWLWIIGASTFVGFRLMFTPSPYRALAQVFFPALFALILQGVQIDVDHWRQVFLCFGAVWGLEAARLRWQARQRDKTGSETTAEPVHV